MDGGRHPLRHRLERLGNVVVRVLAGALRHALGDDQQRRRILPGLGDPAGEDSSSWILTDGSRSSPRPSAPEDLARRVEAGRAHDAAAGMGRGAAKVESADGGAVLRPAR